MPGLDLSVVSCKVAKILLHIPWFPCASGNVFQVLHSEGISSCMGLSKNRGKTPKMDGL